MPRPHEDRERHTLVDHRPGGPEVNFANGSWCAIDTAHARAERADAMASAYETLLERRRASGAGAHPACVLRSVDRARVMALVGLPGHAEFKRLGTAWNDHHLLAEHRAVAKTSSLALYRATDVAGEVGIDPACSDRYAFEWFPHAPHALGAILVPLAQAAGFRGAIHFASDDGAAAAMLYRFEHEREFEAFRSTPAVVAVLGPMSSEEEAGLGVHVIKTFAAGL
jgi:hypothetical protein